MKPIDLIARGVALHRGRILVCRNRKKGNCYLPGGHIEPTFADQRLEAIDIAEAEILAVILFAG